jgi:hypothetical protein
MPKQFFTEHDIEDLVKSGVLTLDMTTDTVLTDLAYEKARRLGMRLVQPGADTPPGAPIRPYLSQKPVSPTTPTFSAQPTVSASSEGDLAERIKKAVTAKMGNQVDPALLDVIIQRVLKSTGMK